MNIIIDTDPGQDIDDILAMWFALKRPEFSVRAITTVTYPTEARARLARRLTELLGRDDIPVGVGMQTPMRPFAAHEMAFQRDFSKSVNHNLGVGTNENARPYPDAVSLIIDTVRKHPHDIAITCLGPQTNIAAALMREPDIAPMIDKILMMGGEFTLNRLGHNVSWDYNAANIVMHSGIPLVYGSWSVTRRFTLSMQDCEIFKDSSAPAAKEIYAAVQTWHPAQNWKPGPVMYDIFPLIHLLAPGKYYETEKRKIAIETSGGANTRGMTVFDPNGVESEIAKGIDEAAVRKLFFETVLGCG